MEGRISWEERTTNKQWGGNIINRSTETIRQCKYEKCQAKVHEPLQEWTLSPSFCTRVTSVYEDKRERALDGGIGGRQRVRSVLSSTLMFHPPSVLPNRHRSIHLTVPRSPLLQRGRQTLMKTLDQRRYEPHSSPRRRWPRTGDADRWLFSTRPQLDNLLLQRSGRRRPIYNLTTTDLSYFLFRVHEKWTKKKEKKTFSWGQLQFTRKSSHNCLVFQ